MCMCRTDELLPRLVDGVDNIQIDGKTYHNTEKALDNALLWGYGILCDDECGCDAECDYIYTHCAPDLLKKVTENGI